MLMFKLDFELDPTGYIIDAHKGESSSPNIRALLEMNVQWMLGSEARIMVGCLENYYEPCKHLGRDLLTNKLSYANKH